MSIILNREDISDKYKWDLSLILDKKEISNMIDRIMSDVSKILDYKGNLNKDNIGICLKAMSNIDLEIDRLYSYSFMNSDLDKSDPKFLEITDKAMNVYVHYSSLTSFFMPEVLKFKMSDLVELKNSKELADFSGVFDDIIRSKKHILTEKEEKILSNMGQFTDSFREVFSAFDNVNVNLGKVHINGEEIELSQGLFHKAILSKDRDLRKEAYDNLYNGYSSYINTLAASYIGHVKCDCMLASTRKYKSSLDSALYNEKIPTKVYYNLINAVNSNISTLHKYVKFRKQQLKLKEMNMYDMYVPIYDEIDEKINFEDAFDLVLKALSPLGEEYISEFSKAKNERWIDVFETKNKRTGAYETAVYGLHPYVLLNFNETINDTFTLAHEMGHAMHSFYSNKYQCFEKSRYPIFLAEIASTVNEVLLIKYLLKTRPEQRNNYLVKYLEMFRTTLFRQTMFSEFEEFTHSEIEKGNPLSYKVLNDFYAELNKKYYGNFVITDDKIATEWSRIPHFYSSFYVYKYATGFTCAVIIAKRILKDSSFVEKYKQFLKSGCSLYPLDTLKLVDIDLTKLDPFKEAMEEFKWALNELKF